MFGLFGSPNFGNEATLAAFLHGMRQRIPLVRFVCIVPRQARAVEMHGVDSQIEMLPLPVGSWFWRVPVAVRERVERIALAVTNEARLDRAARSLAECEALFVPGTGVIDDFGQGPDDLPAHLERWTLAARRCALPMHVVGVGVSRVSHPNSRARFLNALNGAATCSFRDTVSADNARELGFFGVSEVCPDLAFSLPASWLPTRIPDWPPQIIGLGVMGFRGWNAAPRRAQAIYDDYLRRTVVVASGLLKAGYRVRLLIGDQRADAQTPADLVALLASRDGRVSERLFAPSIATFGDLLREIGECDLVVATRYHNVLLSLMTGRSVVSIGYSDKNNALMADLGQAARCHDIEAFEPKAILDDVASLASAPSPAPCLLAQAAAFRGRLDTHFTALAANWT